MCVRDICWSLGINTIIGIWMCLCGEKVKWILYPRRHVSNHVNYILLVIVIVKLLSS
jgi:hypothetical protein